jgi:hypothetical protein
MELTDLDPWLWVYSSNLDPEQPSGAYIFRPKGPAVPLYMKADHVDIVRGALVHEVHVHYHAGHIQVFRLKQGVVGDTLDSSLEMLIRFNTLERDQELVMRCHHLFDEHAQLESDANALWMQARVQPQPDLPAANFYPMVAMASIHNGSHQVSFFNDRSLAVGHQLANQVEFMLHRRTSKDDKRGVDEPLDDTSAIMTSIHMVVHERSRADEVVGKFSIEKRFPILALYQNGQTKRPTVVDEIGKDKSSIVNAEWHLESLQVIQAPLHRHEGVELLLRLRPMTAAIPEATEESVSAFVEQLLKNWNIPTPHMNITQMSLSGVMPYAVVDERMKFRTKKETEDLGHQNTPTVFTFRVRL